MILADFLSGEGSQGGSLGAMNAHQQEKPILILAFLFLLIYVILLSLFFYVILLSRRGRR